MRRYLSTPLRGLAALAVGSAGLVGALAACNIIVDAGAYHVVYPADGSSTTGDDGGTMMMGSQGDGSCGSVAIPTSTGFQQVVNACVLAASCDQDLFAVNISTCVTDDYLHAYGSLGCLTSITSCDDYYSCQGSSIAEPSACTDTSSFSDEGNCSSAGVATSCFYSQTDPFNTVSNCAMQGGTCTVYDEDGGTGQAAGCLLGSCSDTDGQLHCKGTAQIYTCINGSAYGQTCPSASLCGTINGSSSCYYQSQACTTPGASCSNDVLSICGTSPVSSGATNETVNYNCATSGLQCSTDDAGSGNCISPGCQGGQSTCAEDCDSSSGIITFCVGGATSTYDCTAHGFNSCGTQLNNSNNFAFCTY